MREIVKQRPLQPIQLSDGFGAQRRPSLKARDDLTFIWVQHRQPIIAVFIQQQE